MAHKKKKRAVIYSGIIPVAQKQMVTRESAAAFDSSGENEAGGNSRRSTAPVKLSADIAVLILVLGKLNLSPFLCHLKYCYALILKVTPKMGPISDSQSTETKHNIYLFQLTSIQFKYLFIFI